MGTGDAINNPRGCIWTQSAEALWKVKALNRFSTFNEALLFEQTVKIARASVTFPEEIPICLRRVLAFFVKSGRHWRAQEPIAGKP
jgi:hypothetical protein